MMQTVTLTELILIKAWHERNYRLKMTDFVNRLHAEEFPGPCQ